MAPASANSVSATPSCSSSSLHPKRQLRGEWIATVGNIDWPSQPGLSVEQQQQEYVQLLTEAHQTRLNAVFTQVRPTADAFYSSPYEPWSQWLSGTQGKDPGYDALKFLVTEAHQRNLEFHAWINPYRVSKQTDLTQLAPSHPARQHPDWVVRYGDQLYYNPGVPAARKFVAKAILDVVKRYDIDGVHIDDYFYPYPIAGQEFPDESTFQTYRNGFTNKDDWRRNNVNLLVRELSERIFQIKPEVKFGISPFGIWRNKSSDPSGSDTTGLESYDANYADTRTWIQNGWIDYIAPQLYWPIGYPPAAYDTLVSWWSNEVADTPVQLYIGQAAHKIGATTPSGWADPEQMPRHLQINRNSPAVRGDIYFRARSLRENPLSFTQRLQDDFYRYPALIPVMPQRGGEPPRPVPVVHAAATAAGVELDWGKPPGSPKATYYAIYRFDGTVPPSKCDFENTENLLATVRAVPDGQQTFLDDSAVTGRAYTYSVTAVDRLHHESAPSPGSTVLVA